MPRGMEPDSSRRSRDPRLQPLEREILESIFASSLDLEPIRLVFGGILTAFGYSRTIGNTIALVQAYRSDANSLRSRCLLVHEATHVWQNQNLGKRYIAGAIWEHLTRADPYHFDLFPERSFLSYGYEAQASLIAELYRHRRLGVDGAETRRLEVLRQEMLAVGSRLA
jgi:hypothetical protein